MDNNLNSKTDELIKKAKSDGAKSLLSNLSQSDKEKLNKVLSDKDELNKILNSPIAKELMKKFSLGGKNG